MQTISRRVFTHEQRAEAVKLVNEQVMGVIPATKKLALSVKTFSRRVRVAPAGVLERVDAHRAQSVSDLQAEVSRLKRELAVAREERDILKNHCVLRKTVPVKYAFIQQCMNEACNRETQILSLPLAKHFSLEFQR
jgi:transposase-like protein